jgi:cysteinyl-tRNA synthetase
MRLVRLCLVALLLAPVLMPLGVGLAGVLLSPPRQVLNNARSWHFQLQRANIEQLAQLPADVLVVDASLSGPTTAIAPGAEVARLKVKPDGSRRIVLAYFSVGEAEDYRWYWRPEWKATPPPWLGPESCYWPTNYPVRFWAEEWREIIYRGEGSYLARILAAGFDGVYLDRVDVYWQFRKELRNAREHMIGFVQDLADAARSINPGALIVPQNAEELLSDPSYRAVIDALGKEDLIYGAERTGQLNSRDAIRSSVRQLKLLRREGKPVFVVEYLREPEKIAAARAAIVGQLGHRLTIETRALDGSDPLSPRQANAGPQPEDREAECAKAGRVN